MGEFLESRRYGTPFRDWYLVPQVAAVWSASAADALAFPATTFIQFCINHSLVQAIDRPQWRTVSRRSREYVRRIAAALPADRTTVRLNSRVVHITRHTAGVNTSCGSVTIRDDAGDTRGFDHVVMASHSDQTLSMLSDADADEKAALSALEYSANTAYLHTDDTLMPQRRAAWSSWNYMGKGRDVGVPVTSAEPCCVTYWLNRLQNLSPNSGLPELFVTLNPPAGLPAPAKVIETLHYSHPQMTAASVAAQASIDRLQGRRRTWFAGAYLGYGFHEDGATSGIRVAFRLAGVRPPWWDAPLYVAPSALRPSALATTGQRGAVGRDDAGATHAALSTLSPISLLRLKKASGGPYWRDNLGNGGAVGAATAAVIALVRDVRRCRVHSASSASDLIGTTSAGDISGFVVESAGDVLAAYRALVLEPTTLGRRDGATFGGSSVSSGENEDGDIGDAVSSSAGEAAAVDANAAPQLRQRSANRGKTGSTGSRRSDEKGGASVTAFVQSDASSVSTRSPREREGSGTPSSAALLSARRAFKSAKVGEALVTALKRGTADDKATSSRGSDDKWGPAALPSLALCEPLGPRMASGAGGYTAQEQPLHAPEAYGSSLTAWAWEAGRYAVLRAAAYPVLSFLGNSVKIGALLLRTPDGVETLYGDADAAAPLRARLRIHSWAFFLRVAAETDLGLARGFIAGECTTDDLTALFNVFIANRERSSLKAYGLWTAWVGVTLNYLSFSLSMDNSVAGSRKNIHAHYDLSNDLFTAFLDPGTMMYSCGFFDTTRRYVVDVDLASTGTDRSAAGDGNHGEAGRTTAAGAAACAAATLPVPRSSARIELMFGGTLEEAQTRKLDHLIARACVSKHHTVLDLGFGWGGLSIRLAETIGCRVHGITLSKEQFDLATERVRARGLSDLITFEIVDYRDFAAAHRGEIETSSRARCCTRRSYCANAHHTRPTATVLAFCRRIRPHYFGGDDRGGGRQLFPDLHARA